MTRTRWLALALGAICCCHRGAAGPEPVSADQAEPADADAERQRLVRAELERYDTYPVAFDASELSEQDRAFLGSLMRAASLIDELNMLQAHPRNLEWHAAVAEGGTDDDRELYRRYQIPWCHDDTSAACTALADASERDIGAYHWPEGMTDEEYEAIGRAPNARELLSPFTVVRRDGEGRWRAIPYSQTDLFGPRMAGVAEALREAAEHADTESMRRFLRSRAEAFVADSPFPWDRSDYDWIALDSRWEVTVGPYEVYRNPRRIKARFQMYVGIVDPTVTEATAPFREELQGMENALAELVGEDVYSPRQLSGEGIAIRAVRVVVAAGDARNPVGATIAYHLPNRGPSVDEGLYKKVILVNHMAAFDPIVQARARLVLDAEQAAMAGADEAVLDTTFHEFAHGIGAYDELRIRSGAEETTVGEALGDLTTLFEEEKADVVGLWLMERQRRAGQLSDEQASRWYVAHVMHLFGLLQYSLEGTYPQMVAVQLGFFMDRGAVTYDEGTGHFRVVLDAIPAATEELARVVARIQLGGDRAGAEALVSRYVLRNEDGTHRLAPLLDGPATTMRARFESAGIRSVNMRYDVTGL